MHEMGGAPRAAKAHERDPEAVAKFVEAFASALADAGFPRMPARVFVALLASDSGRLTAAELADQLRVSPAAISGAVRYLIPLNLVRRERDPGSRRDHYQVHDDAWYESTVRREQLLARWEESVRQGIDALGPDTAAGARMAETLAYFEFVRAELPAVLERWREYRADLREQQLRTART
jgi:predicted transcriptional regulator